jgi:hypothetical protein
VSPGGHQRGAGAVPGTIVLEACLCPEPGEIEWSRLGNRTVRFGGHDELVLASVLVMAFASGTLSCSAATSSGIFSALGFASLSAEASLLDHVLQFILPGSSAEDPSFGAPCSCRRPGIVVVFKETGCSDLAFWTIRFSCTKALLSCWWPTYP